MCTTVEVSCLVRVIDFSLCGSVLKLLKMAKGIRALLDTVMQALPQVGNLGLLFFLLFFIFAALGVELFGRLGELLPCGHVPTNVVASAQNNTL